MGSLKINKSRLVGVVKVPPSKSMAHRTIICAALSEGISKIENIDYSDDMIATIEGMRALGAHIKRYDDYLEIKGVFSNQVELNNKVLIDCNESGSTLRFLIPIALLFERRSRFLGKGNLGKRPLNTYFNIFDEQNIKYIKKDNELDLIIEGILKSGEFKVKGNISSQFITGLLFTLPLLKGDSKIIVTTDVESKSYIDLTLSCMKEFGVEVTNNDYKEFIIKGKQKYISRNYKVEGDYSQGAFYLCANALGNNVLIKDLNIDSLQGDKEIISILERMGVVFKENSTEISEATFGKLVSTIIDGSQCPDIVPVLAAVASVSNGTTEIINAGRLRIKECDRLLAIKTELSKLGADIEQTENGLIINGKEELIGGTEVWSWRDHRIAMTLAIISTRCKEEIILKDYECISKSYPEFFEDFKRLGGDVNEWHVGQ